MTGSPITLLTYNIRHGRGMDNRISLARIAGVVRDVEPHVACLQELDQRVPRSGFRDQPRELGRLTGMTPLYGPTIHWPAFARFGNAVLTRVQVLGQALHALPGGREPRGMVEVRFSAGAWIVAVFCTHFGLSEEERVAQAETAVEIMRACGQPAILAGDLNEEPGGKAHQVLRDAGLLRLGPSEGTFPSGEATVTIDHVYATPGWRMAACDVIPSLASDHRPVVMDLLCPDSS